MARRTKMLHVDEIANDNRVVACYARVSTDRQAEEGYSIDIQKEKLVAYVKATMGTNVRTELYIDDGFSGGSIDRPAIQRLISDVRQRRISKVVVCKLDRLSRSQKDTIYLMEDVFIANNTAFISINESFDSSTAFGRAVVGILAVFAQLERENIFERTRGGMQKRVEAGYWMGGGRIPFGYDYDQAKGILVPNADAPLVQKMYELYIDGKSFQAIADELGLKYDRLVQQIITRKSNAGYIVYNGVEYKGLHEPIVSLETYELAMEHYRVRSKKHIVTQTHHLLTGLVHCGKCGAAMRYQKWGKTDCKIICYSQQKSRPYLIKDPNCDNKKQWARDLEEVVIDDLFALTSGREKSSNQSDLTMQKSTSQILEEQKTRSEAKLKRLYGTFSENADPVLLAVISELREEIGNLEKRIQAAQEAEEEERERLGLVEKIHDLQDGWAFLTIEQQRTILNSVIEDIIITGDKVDIHYKI